MLRISFVAWSLHPDRSYVHLCVGGGPLFLSGVSSMTADSDLFFFFETESQDRTRNVKITTKSEKETRSAHIQARRRGA